MSQDSKIRPGLIVYHDSKYDVIKRIITFKDNFKDKQKEVELVYSNECIKYNDFIKKYELKLNAPNVAIGNRVGVSYVVIITSYYLQQNGVNFDNHRWDTISSIVRYYKQAYKNKCKICQELKINGN